MKTKATILSFAPSFEGYLSAVHTAFDENLEVIDIRPSREKTALLFNEVRYIPSDRQKAREIWDALSQKGAAYLRLAYFAFLSENQQLLFSIYEYIFLLFRAEHPESTKKFRELKTSLSTWAQRVEDEKRKLEATLYFQPRYGVNCCRLRPLYDVLPLLTRHCRLRFGSDPWVLIDTKRRYGIRKEATGIECFPLPVDSFYIAENAGEANWQEREGETVPQGAHPLQAAV